MNEKIIKKTQDSLGKIIKKPPLTEKLLNKPPFRFLHDVVTSVIKTTGFMKGLYEDSELNSDNVKDKDSKITFLQKAIDLVSLVNGKPLSARPSKIVTGGEPEKTNEFLQALAEAINKKVDNDEYVQQVKGGKKSSAKKRESSADKGRGDREPSSDRRKRDRENGEEKKDEDRKHRRDKDERREKKERERSRDGRDRSHDKEQDRQKKENDEEKEERREKDKERKRRRDKEREREKEQGEEKEEEAPVNGAKEDDEANRKGVHFESKEDGESKSRSRRDKKETPQANVGEDDVPPQVAAGRSRMQRPGSARPAPPRVKKNEPVLEEPVSSGNVPNLIVDKGDSSDEDDGFIAKEDDVPPPMEDEAPPRNEDEEEGEHGGLVKKILEKKKELETHAGKKKTEIERPQVNDAAKKKEREMVQKEIDKLRGTIQTLTRSANPLGKIMDFVQEDLDSMQKELEMWRKENKANALALQREQGITESSIEPLKAQLTELDQQTADQLDLIAAVKSNIIRNDDKINKMLSTVTKS